MWEWLTPFHPMFIAHNPTYAHVATVLRDEEAMVLMTERPTTSIH